jgi:hypothetical protein
MSGRAILASLLAHVKRNPDKDAYYKRHCCDPETYYSHLDEPFSKRQVLGNRGIEGKTHDNHDCTCQSECKRNKRILQEEKWSTFLLILNAMQGPL